MLKIGKALILFSENQSPNNYFKYKQQYRSKPNNILKAITKMFYRLTSIDIKSFIHQKTKYGAYFCCCYLRVLIGYTPTCNFN